MGLLRRVAHDLELSRRPAGAQKLRAHTHTPLSALLKEHVIDKLRSLIRLEGYAEPWISIGTSGPRLRRVMDVESEPEPKSYVGSRDDAALKRHCETAVMHRHATAHNPKRCGKVQSGTVTMTLRDRCDAQTCNCTFSPKRCGKWQTMHDAGQSQVRPASQQLYNQSLLTPHEHTPYTLYVYIYIYIYYE